MRNRKQVHQERQCNLRLGEITEESYEEQSRIVEQRQRRADGPRGVRQEKQSQQPAGVREVEQDRDDDFGA
jgi:hypothetical protein